MANTAIMYPSPGVKPTTRDGSDDKNRQENNERLPFIISACKTQTSFPQACGTLKGKGREDLGRMEFSGTAPMREIRPGISRVLDSFCQTSFDGKRDLID